MPKPRTPDELKRLAKKLRKDPSFIALKRYDYDISKLEDRYDECPVHIIAAALLINENEVEEEVQKVILKLRNLMGIRL